MKQEDIPVVLVNPHHVRKSKELDDNSPTKNDTKDARVIGKLVLDGRYTEPKLPEGVYAELRILMNQSDRLNKDLTRSKGRIHNWLDRYFPEHTRVFKNWEGKASLITLSCFPLPQDVVNAGEEHIAKEWKKEVQRSVGLKRAQLLVRTAKKSIGITAGVNAARIELAELLEHYAMLSRQIDELMKQVEEELTLVPGAQAMLTTPCVGVKTVAGLYAEIGDLTGYAHPQQIIRHAGLSLKENSSGQHKGETTIIKRGRSRLRAILYKTVLILVPKNAKFRALHQYLTTRRDNPLKKKQSLIALCGKLVRILFKLGQKQQDYDASKVLGPYRET
ncbi:IS110 family transposase [Desulfoscipio sp. XC116]|uniref:IS110 family transposase n=1 Tax=Desulfoscipio sp. XC116 TaxID=3144975 RepID=UPI00325B87B9